MDDVRLYNSQLSEEQVALLFAESEASCTSCSSNATLLSHWNMDVCSLNGSSGEIVDVVSGINGQAVDGARAENYGRFVRRLGSMAITIILIFLTTVAMNSQAAQFLFGLK